MSVSHNNFLDVAEHNLALGSEIGYRMAVGRCYYAMFHKILDSVTGYQYEGVGGTHNDLCKYFTELAAVGGENIDKISSKKIGYALQQAKSNRVIADYHIQSSVDKSTAEFSIATAKKFFDTVDAILKPAKAS